MTITFRAKTPEDLLAAIPVTLGFEPRDSIVMLTFGGAQPVHARIDLPPRGDPLALDGVVAALLDACRRNPAARAVFVLYCSGAGHGRRIARRLRRDFERAAIEVVDCLRVDGGRWYSADGRRAGVPSEGVPYDSSGHPFRAQAVMAGHVTFGSRDELAASIAADPEGRDAVRAALEDAVLLSAEGLAALCDRHASAGTSPTDQEVAALLLTLQLASRRDAAWAPLTREVAGGHVLLWRDVVRRAPEELMPAAAAVLGFVAWLHGDGALAWCALDRCLKRAPEHRLGTLVAAMLAGALPPSAWVAMQESLAEVAAPGDALDLVRMAAQPETSDEPATGDVEDGTGEHGIGQWRAC